MGLQILPQQGTLASNLGSGIGQGLSQQLPEEIKRYRLSKGLENLGKNQESQTPYQMLSSLASIPGMDPGLLGILAPALQQQFSRNEQSGVVSQNTPNQNNQRSQENIPLRREEREGYLLKASPQQEEAEAQRLYKTEPYTYPNLNLARARASEFLNKEYEADVSYKARQDLFETDFDKAIKSYSGKEKSLQEGEIGGSAREKIRNDALKELSLSKKSPNVLADEAARKVIEIAKDKQSMKKLADKTFPGEVDIKGLRSIKKKYQSYGIPEDIFIDDLVENLGITKAAASYISNPMENTETGKLLHSKPPIKSLSISSILPSIKFNNTVQQLAKDIEKTLSQEDNIGSILYLARKKGYNPENLRKYLLDIPANKITKQQALDLQNMQTAEFLPPLAEGWLLGWGNYFK